VTYRYIPPWFHQDPPHRCRKSLPHILLTSLFHQFLSPVRRKKKNNRAPFVVENRKKRPKTILLYQSETVKIQTFFSYIMHQPVFTVDGGSLAVVSTKNKLKIQPQALLIERARQKRRLTVRTAFSVPWLTTMCVTQTSQVNKNSERRWGTSLSRLREHRTRMTSRLYIVRRSMTSCPSRNY